MNGVRISGTGSYLPQRCLTNEDLETLYPANNAKWIQANLGIKERRIVSSNEKTSDISVAAAKQALKDAQIGVNEIDLVIVATATPDRAAPSTAAILVEKLQMPAVIAFDVSAVCSGFLFALVTASQYIKSGMVSKALVIGADTFSRITDWNRRDAGFFGDGAGAVVISSDPDGDTMTSDMRVIGGVDNFTVHSDMPYFSMDAKSVAQSALSGIPNSVHAVFETLNISAPDIDHVIPHQPSIRLLKNISNEIEVPWAKFHLTMDKFANTAAATIPITLDKAARADKLFKNQKILFLSAGAGMSTAATVYRWH